MTVQVQLFARYRDLFGTDAAAIDLPGEACVASLRSAIARVKPEAAGLLERTRIAVNGEFAAGDLILRPTDEIALIPPVSGG